MIGISLPTISQPTMEFFARVGNELSYRFERAVLAYNARLQWQFENATPVSDVNPLKMKLVGFLLPSDQSPIPLYQGAFILNWNENQKFSLLPRPSAPVPPEVICVESDGRSLKFSKQGRPLGEELTSNDCFQFGKQPFLVKIFDPTYHTLIEISEDHYES